MLLLNYKYLSPAHREMRCSVSRPRFQEFGFLSEETPQEISQTKPAKGEAAYLTTSRQNRFFFCSPCPPFFFHLEEPACDTHCPGAHFSSPKAAGSIPSFHAVAQCLILTWGASCSVPFTSAYFEALQSQTCLSRGD